MAAVNGATAYSRWQRSSLYDVAVITRLPAIPASCRMSDCCCIMLAMKDAGLFALLHFLTLLAAMIAAFLVKIWLPFLPSWSVVIVLRLRRAGTLSII